MLAFISSLVGGLFLDLWQAEVATFNCWWFVFGSNKLAVGTHSLQLPTSLPQARNKSTNFCHKRPGSSGTVRKNLCGSF